MTEKQPVGQNVPHRNYRYHKSAPVSRSLVRRNVINRQHVGYRQVSGTGVAQSSQAIAQRRVVTTHQEAVRPMSWAERQERFRNPSTAQAGQKRLVQRTFSQTGRPAPVGQRRANKPLPRQQSSSRVPRRSGKLKRNNPFWRRVLGFLALLVVIVGGVSFALTSSTFHVQQVQISGTHNQALIFTIQHLGIQGQDVFLLNQSALVTRLEASPLVAAASLSIQLPNNILVTIQERVPVLLWQSAGQTFGVAQDGMVIAASSELSGSQDLVKVVDKRTTAVRPGQRLNTEDIRFVEQAFQQLSGIKGLAPFTLQYMDHVVEGKQSLPANQARGGSYVIASSQGWQAYLGDAQNSNPLANRLLELQQILSMAQRQQEQLATIDLRFGSRPTYTLKP